MKLKLRDYIDNLPQIEFYSNNLRKYLTRNPIKRKIIEKFITAIVNTASLRKPPSLLDAGCGEGEILFYVRGLMPGARVVGLDVSRDALKIAKCVVKDVDFVLGDVRSAPFKEDAFHTTLCLEVLEHVQNLHEVLDELCRTTNSRLVLSVPHPLFFRLGNLLTLRNVRGLGENRHHAHRFSKPFLHRVLNGKFKTIKVNHASVWLVAACDL